MSSFINRKPKSKIACLIVVFYEKYSVDNAFLLILFIKLSTSRSLLTQNNGLCEIK